MVLRVNPEYCRYKPKKTAGTLEAKISPFWRANRYPEQATLIMTEKLLECINIEIGLNKLIEWRI